MCSLFQGLLDNVSAPTAHLRRVLRRNRDDQTTSIFGFHRQDVAEHRPGSISNRLVEASLCTGSVGKELPWIFRVRLCLRAADHVFDLQGFHPDNAETVDEPSGCLMYEVMASGSNTLMDTGDDFLGLATGSGSVLILHIVELALGFRQSLFVTAEEARVFDELAIRERGKDFEANVNADLISRRFKMLRLNLAGEADKPLARGRSANRTRFDVTFNRAVQMYSDITDFGQAETALKEAEATLRIGYAIVLAFALHPRVAWIVSSLDSAKEGLKGKVYTTGDVLQDLRVSARPESIRRRVQHDQVSRL